MKNNKSRASKFPYPIIAVLIFLSIGFIADVWHPTWLIFLTIPIYYGVVEALEKGTNFLKALSYPLLITIVYLILGFVFDLWHPGWLIYLTIPIWAFFVKGDDDEAKDNVEVKDIDAV